MGQACLVQGAGALVQAHLMQAHRCWRPSVRVSHPRPPGHNESPCLCFAHERTLPPPTPRTGAAITFFTEEDKLLLRPVANLIK